MKRIGLILVVGGLLSSCSTEKKASKAFRMGKYQTVINMYQEELKKDPNNGKANYYIAESYRQSNRIQEAEPFYKKARGRGIDADTVMFWHYQSLKANGKNQEAELKLGELVAQGSNEGVRNRADKELSGFRYLRELEEKKNYYRIKNLDALNSTSAEYSPVYLNGELYFSSTRGNSKLYEATGTPFSDLYKVETSGANVNVSTIAPLPTTINTINVNEGCITFSPDGRIMVYAKGNTGKRKGAHDVDLYLSRFRNGTWTDPQLININQPDAWESTPAFSPDGRTLYFSSNRKGGFGGLDLYSAQMDSRGRFGRVRNLGPDINTSGNEIFPYLSENGQLYLASDGHPGYGMLDIFVVNRASGKTTVQNLGKPVNSISDDFAIFLFSPDKGFFTSNRTDGKGDDDIYTFVNEDPNLKVVNYFLQGVTMTDKNDSTRVILPDTKVTLLDHDGEVMSDYVTGNDGKFLFRVYEEENYTLIGETDGYLVKRQLWSTIGKAVPRETLKELVTNITYDTIVVLDKLERNKIFVLENIYFEYNESYIRPDAALELNKLVALLNDNMEIKIELSAHTDSVASHDYNMALSQRRAESTVNYLIKNGIQQNRLVAMGYGETRPIARNTNVDGTDNPDGRQRNRRSEFKILEIGIIQRRPTDEFDEDKYFIKNN